MLNCSLSLSLSLSFGFLRRDIEKKKKKKILFYGIIFFLEMKLGVGNDEKV